MIKDNGKGPFEFTVKVLHCHKFIISLKTIRDNINKVLKITCLMPNDKDTIVFVRNRSEHVLKCWVTAMIINKLFWWPQCAYLQEEVIKTIDNYNCRLNWYLEVIDRCH